jgi:GntR family transcriptional regulator
MEKNMPLIRSNDLPLYHQIKNIILEQISEHGLEPGDKLPGDFELCDTYQVSRTVVRQALSELEFEGVLERIKGKGTFVAKPKTTEHLAPNLYGLFQDAQNRGSSIVSKVLKQELVPADISVATDLEIPTNTQVFELERIRYSDGTPWAWVTSYFRVEVGEKLIKEDLTRASVYEILEQKYGKKLMLTKRSLEARVANQKVATALGIKVGSAVLVLRSVAFDESDTPIERFVAIHRGDMSQFEVVVQKNVTESGWPSMVIPELIDKL